MKRFSDFLRSHFIKSELTFQRSVLLFLSYLSRYTADRALGQVIFVDQILEIVPVEIPAYLFVPCRAYNRVGFGNVNRQTAVTLYKLFVSLSAYAIVNITLFRSKIFFVYIKFRHISHLAFSPAALPN